MRALNLFAGCGGWEEGLRGLGIRPLGIEIEDTACRTRLAAGHATLQSDVSRFDPQTFAPIELLIGSPPCQAWSSAGQRSGQRDRDLIFACVGGLMRGQDARADYRPRLSDPDSLLVAEPLRYVLSLRPRYVALEQVPPVLELWQWFEAFFEELGYHAWAGVLSSECWGLPQVRKRSILMASREGPVHPPQPTHQAYGEESVSGLLPWVSAAEALGLDESAALGFQRREGTGYRERDLRSAAEPAFALTAKARSWRISTGQDWKPDGNRGTSQERAASAPAPTLTGKSRWLLKPPSKPGAFRLQPEQAARLQGFPDRYPWQGLRTQVFRQIGNSFPPPVARAVVGALVGHRGRG